jgi:hypothetical protein
MLTEKSNLLQRVRVVMIALVAVIGFGTMAMKPVERAAHTYGVAETAGGLNWRIVADVTDPSSDYGCQDVANSVCTIASDQAFNINDLVAKTAATPNGLGRFQL